MKLTVLCVFSLAASTQAVLPSKFIENVMLQAWDESYEQDPNIVVSPFSLLAPLGAFILGSEGRTSHEILKALNLYDVNQVVREYTDSMDALEGLDQVEVKFANRLYIREDSLINRYYNHAARKYFNLEVVDLNFGFAEYAANQINSWVSEKTGNRIKNLVDPSSLSEATRSLFVNTVYFEAYWKKPFNTIHDATFYLSDNSTTSIDAMYVTGYILNSNSANLKSKIISIPYENEQCAFTVVLPHITSSLKELKRKITYNPNLINEELLNLRSTYAVFTMPKFEFELKTDLKKVLSNINIKKIFSSESELNDVLVNETLTLNSAHQKAFIKVNEKGTIAAAVNEFIMAGASGGLTPPQINVNRPFYYEIRCSNIVLFNGIVNKPHL